MNFPTENARKTFLCVIVAKKHARLTNLVCANRVKAHHGCDSIISLEASIRPTHVHK